MARKHNTDSDPVVSAGAAAAPARQKSPAKSRVKYSTAQTASATPETTTLQTATPVSEPAAPQIAAATAHEPTSDEIARLAYTYWEARGYRGGSSEEDWLRAERELRARANASLV
jgi:hypothetical protein